MTLINLTNDSPAVAFRCGGNLPALAERVDMDSHRPEAAALCAALCFIRTLLKECPRDPAIGMSPRLDFVLDNKSIAEDDLRWERGDSASVFDCLKSDHDPLRGVQHEICNLPTASSVSWVKGHQGRHEPRSELSLDAPANCIADDACADTRSRPPSEAGRLPDWIPGTQAALRHHGTLVAKKQDDHAHTAATAPCLRARLINKSWRRDPFLDDEWSDEALRDADWQSARPSPKSKSKGEQRQLSKLVNNWTPTLRHRAAQGNGKKPSTTSSAAQATAAPKLGVKPSLRFFSASPTVTLQR